MCYDYNNLNHKKLTCTCQKTSTRVFDTAGAFYHSGDTSWYFSSIKVPRPKLVQTTKTVHVRGMSKKFVEFVNKNKTTVPIAFKFVYN